MAFRLCRNHPTARSASFHFRSFSHSFISITRSDRTYNTGLRSAPSRALQAPVLICSISSFCVTAGLLNQRSEVHVPKTRHVFTAAEPTDALWDMRPCMSEGHMEAQQHERAHVCCVPHRAGNGQPMFGMADSLAEARAMAAARGFHFVDTDFLPQPRAANCTWARLVEYLRSSSPCTAAARQLVGCVPSPSR